MKMYTNCKTSLSVNSWPPERKDIQLLIIKSRMSLLFGGKLSTDKNCLGFVYIFIVPFPVWDGINFNSISCLGWNKFWFQPKPEMELPTYVLICVLTSCHLCQLITDLRRCRMYVSFLALVCLFVDCLFSAFDMKSLFLFQYSRIFYIFKERDISYQKLRTHRHTNTQTHKHTKVRIELLRN